MVTGIAGGRLIYRCLNTFAGNNIRDYLKQIMDDGTKQVRQIIFEGDRFDVMSVRRWRKEMLGPEGVTQST